MQPHKDQLTPAEWIVMNALWERSPMTLSETIAQIGTRAAWNYKTFAAYLAILEKKGFIYAEKRGRDKLYLSLIHICLQSLINQGFFRS